ncbi:amino acid/polyamine transporter I [Suillus clintonianus]|uniref:amino acid/polyamine transporter I n=1 Tax=Suillus clintonianus TaxID=1904413 RepID=UPI001B85BFA6|nr:amino acid/polyamine transporter I [Suillus clintonianus]KAG2135256.1 amino acid/polyamine transporter I [Suillus clintonianus]
MATRTHATSKLHLQPSSDEAILARLGYKQEFRRAFTPLEVFGVAFSYIGLLPSIASVLFYTVPNGGPLAMVWGWAIASVFIMCIGLAIAELASAAPTSGGLYYWTFSLASPRCRNFLAWMVGYSNTIQSITVVASVDWACAIQIMAALSIASDQAYTTTNEQLYGVYAALVLSHAVLVSLGTKFLARLQRLYIFLNVCLCFIVIIALPIVTPSKYRNSASFVLGDFTNLDGWPSVFAFILSLMAPLYTIGGYDSSVHMSEEASNAATAIPWAIISSIAMSAILGWGINISLAFCMGADLSSILNSPIGQPMAQILYNSLGQRGALALWCLVILAQYMMGSSCLLVGSRQTFAFARDGALPFSQYLYRINSYTGTPVNTVWFDAVLVLAIGLLAFVSTQAIDAVFTIAVTASYVSYITPIATRFVFKNNFKPGPFNLGRLSFPVAAIAVSWMVLMIIVFFFPSTPQTNAQEMNYTVVVLGGYMSLAVFWYYCPVFGGVHWFNGPVSNLAPAIKSGYTNEGLILERKENRDTELSVSVADE